MVGAYGHWLLFGSINLFTMRFAMPGDVKPIRHRERLSGRQRTHDHCAEHFGPITIIERKKTEIATSKSECAGFRVQFRFSWR